MNRIDPRRGEAERLRGTTFVGEEAVCEFCDDWDALFERAGSAPIWLCRPWAESFMKAGRVRGVPTFLTAWDGSRLVALLALGVRTVATIRVGRPLTAAWPGCLGILVDPAFRDAIDTIVELWQRDRAADVFCIDDWCSTDDATTQLMERLRRSGFVVRETYRNVVHWIRLGCSFDEYLTKNKSAKSRQTLRRKERLVETAGATVLERYRGPEVTREVVDRLVNIQWESHMKRRGAAFLSEPFFQQLVYEMAQEGLARVWIMTIDGDDAGFIYAYVANRRLEYAWTAYKMQYESLNVGTVMTYRAIQDACDEGILAFDFGQGKAAYKEFWATDAYTIRRGVAGKRARGVAAVGYYSILWRLRGVKAVHRIYRRIKHLRNSLSQRKSQVRQAG